MADSKIPRTCERCKKTFFVYASMLKRRAGRFCSKLCKRTRITSTCKFCKSEFTFLPHHATRKGGAVEFCSHPCYIAYRRSPEYFWSLVEKSDGCWLWQGFRSKRGYGQFKHHGIGHNASRIAYEWTYGAIASEMVVRHTCDNPPCVRPDHLIAGTNADNSKDMVERNRQSKGTSRHNAKATNEIVRAIRREYIPGKVSFKTLAEKYNLSIATTQKIAAGKLWKHVE